MNLSGRALTAPASPIRRMIPFAEQAMKMGKKIYYLNIGQPDIPTPRVYFEYVERYKPSVVAYTHSAGLLELREAFSRYYEKFSVKVLPDEIIVTNGGSEAVLFAMAVVADPGDEILVLEPFYANYAGFAAQLGIKLVPVRTYPEDGYSVPDKKKFLEKISSKTKAIIFSNPCNPTGAVYNESQLRTIIDVALEKDLFIISDEVYREFTFDGCKAISALSFEPILDRVIMVDSISKRYSACGARIGAFVSKNKSIYSAALKFAQARLCPPMTSQYGAIGLLSLDDEYVESIKNEYQARRDVVYEELKKIDGAVFQKPKGAFYISARLPVDNVEEFVKFMLLEFDVGGKTTMVSPLDGFYATPSAGLDEMRIAYVLNCDDLRDAVRILALGVEEYKRKVR
ncbi:pyridoxal phosphate-dependent aminotransferase [Pseudothermotoga thermarum]|uniref:Aminotransferase n=1 Tax=Pseudothermotoga thermarum DSM 5069 TaxID=688269 RepID=F7YYD5_9THEM|nr:pyridoxal phosphate-dependent aminotransferase [Pseudothermotoga thermarum]AEH50958.1 aminotransferase class I and II [Pseudothermotoga thermarum DSM 5069]